MSAPRHQAALARLIKRAQTREDAALVAAAAERLAAEAAQRRHHDDIARLRQLRPGDDQRLDARGFTRHQDQAAGAARAVSASRDDQRLADSRAAEAHALLIARARQRKTYERLDARDRRAAAVRTAKAAQRSLDEFAIQKAVR